MRFELPLLSVAGWLFLRAFEGRGGNRTAVGRGWLGAGSLLGVALVTLYYVSFDFAHAIPRPLLELGLLGVVACGVLPVAPRAPRPSPPGAVRSAAALTLVALVLSMARGWQVPPTPEPPVSLTVATYNIHQGFDDRGSFSLHRQAEVLRATGADVIGLQEVSRGWLVNGSVDTLAWLAADLGMAYAWGPTADAMWGNAILSRYPIRSVRELPMPNNGDLAIRRGVLVATVDVGQPLEVLVTHLHAEGGGSAIRRPQVETVVAAWNGMERAVVVGDFNAEEGDPEMAPMQGSLLVDAYTATTVRSDVDAGCTVPAAAPTRRIDYVWLSPDLEAEHVTIVATRDSDHRPVVARVRLPREQAGP